MSAEASAAKPEPSDHLYQWIALGVIVVGTFMVILDSSIVNVAIPKMMNVFGISVSESKWFVTAYTLTMGATIPLTGYMGVKFGNKKVYMASMAAFTFGSFLCGLAWNHQAMIGARVIQAVGGGMMSPISMAILYEIFPKEKRGMALGFWGIAAMAAPAIGPTLGGYIVEYLNWRMIFYINLPIGVVGFFMSWMALKPSPAHAGRPFDWIGFMTVTFGMVSCLYVLGEGSNIDWGDVTNILLMVFGLFCLGMFVYNELNHPSPMLDIRVLKHFPFTMSILISSVLNMALFGVVFIMPLFLQSLRGLTAMETGILMFPSALATGIMMPISGKLYDKLGVKKVVLPGLMMLVASTWFLSKINMDTPFSAIMWLMVFRGFALGISMMPITTAGMNAIPPDKVSEASALSNAIRQVASSLSVTLLTTLMQNFQMERYSRLAEEVTPFNVPLNGTVSMVQGMLTQSGYSSSGAWSIVVGLIQQQAYVDGIRFTLIVTTGIAAITIPLALMMRETHHETHSVAEEISHGALME